MFSSLLHRKRPNNRRGEQRDASISPSARNMPRRFTSRTHATADFTEADDDDEDDEDDDGDFNGEGVSAYHEDHGGDIDEDNGEPSGLPVLPLFSTTHLDSLPIYNTTHAIRIIVSARTETTLSWEQLRSPQVSQFLVKPMQQQIRTLHFSRATLYALMANCLQFSKEGQRYAANAGISNTRAKVCELLALKMLKEYSTRELIDALAYDFYPLQGLPGISLPEQQMRTPSSGAIPSTASRTSTLEVAIRASAKHFLAHPVIVQQLEAIWNGAISFYSSADTLHRDEAPQMESTAPRTRSKPDARTPLLGATSSRPNNQHVPPLRRTVTLYDPRQASVFKLSRLRVPRYRSFLSTLSLAVLIGLFLAVLIERSVQITGLELVFWFWSAGFMLDELVGFNEQGFALYIMSFWNIFDLGILVLLIVYYFMRVYGIFVADPHHWNDMAYDVLAANAILLLPRIFSILDHYQYFSQLLIAFRLMAVDLAAVFFLVLIMCSGFYVFFTLSNNQSDGAEVAYKIFQILMGFTPAAWDVWPTYNWLARMLMMIFLIICHFLVVTILITVLTNSFMAIASNANEEHQFLFAINTISMVKNDALFSYIAPTNIFAWLLMPLRYCMPLRQFVWLNRTIIKITHFPILICIYLYERFWLAPSMFEPTDLVDNHGRRRRRAISFGDPASRTAIFSPNVRVREESVAGFQKDRALEEVFLRLPDSTTLRTQRRQERRKTQTAIRHWMEQHDEDGLSTQWPTVDSRAVPEWQRRLSMGWDRGSNMRQVSDMRSVASDPAEFLSNPGASFVTPKHLPSRFASMASVEYKDHTDGDGDDELVTNDEDEDDVGTNAERFGLDEKSSLPFRPGYFDAVQGARLGALASSQGSGGAATKLAPPRPPSNRRGMHKRTISSNTILYNPEEETQQPPSPPHPPLSKSPPKRTLPRKPGSSGKTSAGQGSAGAGTKSPMRQTAASSDVRPRPIAPPRRITETSGIGGVSRTALLSIDPRNRPGEARRLSSVDMSVLSDQSNLAFAGAADAPLAGSFQTQMAMAMMRDNRMRAGNSGEAADRDRMGRLVLARMKTLEESFADMIKEVRDIKHHSTPVTRWNSSGEDPRSRRGSVIADDVGPGPASRTRGDVTPRRPHGKRPVSRRSLREGKPTFGRPRDSMGHVQAVIHSSDGEDAEDEQSFLKKGTSL